MLGQIVNGTFSYANLKAWVAGLFLSGILLFSGSLYVLALTGSRLFAWFTPVGGSPVSSSEDAARDLRISSRVARQSSTTSASSRNDGGTTCNASARLSTSTISQPR